MSVDAPPRTIRRHDVETPRGRMHVRETRATDARSTVLFVHGNCSSSAFFDALLRALPVGLRGVAVDLRGYGDTEPLPIDATRGMRDFSDDVVAVLDALGLDDPVTAVGHSAGAGVLMQLAIEHPDRLGSIVLEAPMSPYGFGGTAGPDGTPVHPDLAGSGGGAANPDFVAALAAGDRSTDSPSSPLNVLRRFYVADGTKVADEDHILESVLSTRTGAAHYPGDATASDNWPGVAPGTRGMNNAISPKHFDVSAFANLDPRPPVLWVRGDADAIVSDTSFFDFGHLGALGVVPGWPGADVYPAQPMVTQMRAVLDAYVANGGSYREVVLRGVGHSPHLEQPETFLELLVGAAR